MDSNCTKLFIKIHGVDPRKRGSCVRKRLRSLGSSRETLAGPLSTYKVFSDWPRKLAWRRFRFPTPSPRRGRSGSQASASPSPICKPSKEDDCQERRLDMPVSTFYGDAGARAGKFHKIQNPRQNVKLYCTVFYFRVMCIMSVGRLSKAFGLHGSGSLIMRCISVPSYTIHTLFTICRIMCAGNLDAPMVHALITYYALSV
jgi:hypothetical protein